MPKDVVYPNIISKSASLEVLKKTPPDLTLRGGFADIAIPLFALAVYKVLFSCRKKSWIKTWIRTQIVSISNGLDMDSEISTLLAKCKHHSMITTSSAYF